MRRYNRRLLACYGDFLAALEDGWFCHYCGIALTQKSQYGNNRATLDHVVAKKNGGTDELTNLVLCCFGCNCEKGHLVDYQEMLDRKRLIRGKRLITRAINADLTRNRANRAR